MDPKMRLLQLIVFLAVAATAMGGGGKSFQGRYVRARHMATSEIVIPRRPFPLFARKAAGNLAIDTAALLSFKAGILKNQNSKAVVALLRKWTGTNPCTWPKVYCEGGRVTSLWLSSLEVGLAVNGTLNSTFSDLTMLTQLYIQFSGILFPAPILSLTNLQVLNIGGIRSIPNGIGKLKNLQILGVKAISGSLPSSLWSMTQLQDLTFAGGFTGAVPPRITNLQGLLRLVFYDTFLTGKIWPLLMSFPKLQVVELSNNRFQDYPIPNSIYKLKSLKTLTIDSELGMKGPIPPVIGSLKELKWLSITNVTLTGSIPKQILDASALEFLALAGTGLTGTIPPLHLNPLLNLHFLDLSYNNLQGVLPNALSLEIQFLPGGDLQSNYLGGYLNPKSGIGLMTNCFFITPCNRTVPGQRSFSICSKIYPPLAGPCVPPPPLRRPPPRRPPPSLKKSASSQ